MPVKQQKIEVSAEQLSVIEAALHTQSKILDVQAEAGGSIARQKLNEVKSLLAQLAQQKPADAKPRCSGARGWFGLVRTLG